MINQKRRVTLPQSALLAAGLRDGDLVHARSDGPGRILLEKAGLPVWAEPPCPLAGRRQAEETGDAATIAEFDPSYNPNARED